MKESNSNPIPKFTEEQYQYLLKTFPSKVIMPNDTLGEIHQAAGSSKVVEFVRANIGFNPRQHHRDR